MPNLAAGQLRDRITVEEKVTSKNSFGEVVSNWEEVSFSASGNGKFWAAINYLSARELIASQQMNSQVTCRIVMRYNASVTAAMRIVCGSQIFNIIGVQPDPDSGREWMTMPCSQGMNQGG